MDVYNWNLQTKEDNEVTFVLSSTSSDHIINREDVFTSCVKLETPLKMAVARNGTFISATKKGTMEVTSNMGVRGSLTEVLFCADVPHNLLSVRRLMKKGMTVTFYQKEAEIKSRGKTVIKSEVINNLPGVRFRIHPNKQVPFHQIINPSVGNYHLWHQRLGHISKSEFLQLINEHLMNDYEQICNVIPTDDLCQGCVKGKKTESLFVRRENETHNQQPLFTIYGGVNGPITPTTYDGNRYFVIFVDKSTHFCVTYIVQNRSEVYTVFQDFVSKSEARFKSKVANLYIDNDCETFSWKMKKFCIYKGIKYHRTIPGTPKLNGVALRMMRTIIETARAMIAGAKLNQVFWGEAVLTATYLINLTPTNATQKRVTPYEMWYNRKPQLKYLRIFGSTVHVFDKSRQNKFDNKPWKGILIGYTPNGYKVWNVDTGKTQVVRDVTFDETRFLSKTLPESALLCIRNM